jgi:hypothetical protein
MISTKVLFSSLSSIFYGYMYESMGLNANLQTLYFFGKLIKLLFIESSNTLFDSAALTYGISSYV